MRAIKVWIKEWFYIPKYAKVSDKSLSRIMLSSVFGILICGICLVGLTWAWFSSSITSTANNITAANFTVDIRVTHVGDDTPLSPTEENGKYTYTLSAGTEYAVIITALGDAEKYGGYCSVSYLRANPYHTIQLYPGTGDGKIHSVTFTVNASDASELTITPQWGTYVKPDDEVLIGNSDGDIDTIPPRSLSLLGAETDEPAITEETQTYHLTESEQSYTVKQGDTLSNIAARYGTTVAVLSAYNNITNTNTIQTGSSIKIPPASYTIPKTTTTQPTATESTATEPSVTAPSVTEPSVSETPNQTEESSSAVSIEPSSQETEPKKTTASETQSVPDTDTTGAATDEP